MTLWDKFLIVARQTNLAMAAGLALGYVPVTSFSTGWLHFVFWPALAIAAIGYVLLAVEAIFNVQID